MLARRHILILIFTFIILPCVAHADLSSKKIYVFGDSLSDTGNLASLIGDFPSPPFYQNRVSNGPVAVEVLAARLGTDVNASLHLVGPAVGTNYAVAGARAADTREIDLGFQVQLFLLNHLGVAPADALYIIMIGGNDLRGTRELDAAASATLISEARQAVISNIETLYASGARNFLVFDVPDIGNIPETHIIAEQLGDPALPMRTSFYVRQYNRRLHVDLVQFRRHREIELVEFSLFRTLNNIIRKGKTLGFTNVSDPCFYTEILTPNPECNFDSFVFFDEIHPTARVHEIIATRVYKKLSRQLRHEHEQSVTVNLDQGAVNSDGRL